VQRVIGYEHDGGLLASRLFELSLRFRYSSLPRVSRGEVARFVVVPSAKSTEPPKLASAVRVEPVESLLASLLCPRD
jgi:hypothetical protein